MQQVSIPEMVSFLDHMAVRRKRSVMVWGQPGVGKSQGVNALTAKHSALMVDIRLSMYDSVDLRGIPVPTDEGMTVWHVPSTLPFDTNPLFSDDGLTVLFLDEINAAAPSVLAVAYQLIHDRRVGEHKLRDNVVVIAAGNREGDKGVTNRMPTPLANRFTHIEAVVSVDAFCDYAQSVGLPPIGIAFLQWRKELLSTFDPSRPDKAFATPRTWEWALRDYADDELPGNIMRAALIGTIGEGPALEFLAFTEVWSKMIPLSEILADPMKARIPEELSACYAVAINVSGAMAVGPNLPKLHAYLMRLDPEFAVMAWQLAVKRESGLLTTPEFVAFAKEYKQISQAVLA